MSTIGVFIDRKKAYDTINDDTLVKKLRHYAIRRVASECIESYLSNRKQFVKVDNVY